MKNKRSMIYRFCAMAAAMTMAVSAGSCAAPVITENAEPAQELAAEPTEESTEQASAETTAAEPETEAVSEPAKDRDLFSKRDLDPSYSKVNATITLNGSSASVDGSGAEAEGSAVTVKEEGVYLISGILSDGQIVVDADKAKVQLVLDNADITCKSGPAIIGNASDKIFLTLAKGSTNILSGGSAESGACISSADSLTINGSGALEVKSEADGIHSKDDIVITGGTINIDAAGDGIKGKDYVAAADGTVTVKAGQDGIKASNETDADKGFVYIEDGTFSITSGNDGIQAFSDVTVKCGTVDIVSGGGSANSTKKHSDFGFGGGDFGGGGFGGFGDFDPSQFGDMTMPDFSDFDPSQFEGMTPPDGFGNWDGDFDPSQFGGMNPPGGSGRRQDADGRSSATEKKDDTGTSLNNLSAMAPSGSRNKTSKDNAEDSKTADDTSSDSTKGIKGGFVDISGGSITVDSADDALHSNGDISITDGTLTLTAGDDGIHADSALSISGGAVDITESYEGIEAASISISDGMVKVRASDDGFNASDGTEQGGMGRYSSGAAVDISGGTVYVDADGDGLDSNGDLNISGGTVIVNGPVNGANGALDSNGEIKVTGGLVIAAGSSGMAEYPGEKSTQYSVSATFDSTLDGGTLVTLTDEKGRELLSFAPAKKFSNIVISSPDITEGDTYRIYTGGTTAADSGDFGLSSGGYKEDGKEAGSFTVSSPTSFIGQQSMMGGGFGGGRPGGREGQDFQMPTDENGEVSIPEGGFGKGRRGNKPAPDSSGDTAQ